LCLVSPWSLGLAFALVVGATLRLIWGADIEYKLDEAWTFARTQHVGHSEPFRWVGMPTSRGSVNPGLSLWVFLILSQLFAADNPVDLARAVQLLNVAALIGMTLFALWAVPRDEREPWLWAAALMALNPLTVLYQRKIWPPSVVPILTVVMLAGWWYRQRRVGAFTWGLIGMCIGQIHLAGFFLLAGFAAWALLFQRQSVRWLSWVAGCALGALPMLPWLYDLSTGHEQPPARGGWVHLVEGTFWLRWVSEPLGASVEYTLGQDFSDFLTYPVIGGQPTYLVGLFHAVLGGTAVVLLGRAAWSLWQGRHDLASLAIGRHSRTAFTQNAAFWGFGILLTASVTPIQRHYLWVACPLGFVWLARQALGGDGMRTQTWRFGRALLLVLCLTQGLISAHFLGYVHFNQRAIRGDYWMPFGAQTETDRSYLEEMAGKL
jgi:hypothetical protein